MKNFSLILVALSIFFITKVFAQANIEILPKDKNQDLTLQMVEEKVDKYSEQSPKNISISIEDLKKNPQVLEKVLDQAIEQNQIKLIKKLLPIYEKHPQHDPLLVIYAQAKIAMDDGNTNKAIELLKQITTERPDLTPSRFHLATVLFADNRIKQAKNEFNKIKNDPYLPPEVEKIVDNYLNEIAKQEKWQFNLNLYYIEDKNVNNSANLPPETKPNCGSIQNCSINYPQAEQAHGLGFALGAKKDININTNKYWRINTDNYAKYYWDNKDYNDISFNISTGPVWRYSNNEIAILPYISHRIYGNNTYSNNIGLNLNNTWSINNKTIVFSALDFADKKHPQREYLDGKNISISNTLLYIHSPEQYFSLGFDLGTSGAQDKAEEYKYTAIRTSWIQNWNGQINSNLQVGIMQRNYQDINFFGTKRQDDIFYAQASIYKKNWNIAGFTPRLVSSFNRTKSNQKFYSYDKSNIYVDLIKNF